MFMVKYIRYSTAEALGHVALKRFLIIVFT